MHACVCCRLMMPHHIISENFQNIHRNNILYTILFGNRYFSLGTIQNQNQNKTISKLNVWNIIQFANLIRIILSFFVIYSQLIVNSSSKNLSSRNRTFEHFWYETTTVCMPGWGWAELGCWFFFFLFLFIVCLVAWGTLTRK